MKFCVVSQSTLSSGQGRRVPVEGVNANWRAWRLPCQLSPYFSSRSSTALAKKLLENLEVNLVFDEDFREQGLQLVNVFGYKVG